MTRKFNWYYNTAHPLGQSRIADERDEAMATFTMEPLASSRRVTRIIKGKKVEVRHG